MAAKTGTYTLIASNTLNSSTTSVTFSSIPSTYTDLILVMNCWQPSSTGEIQIQFNGDTGTNYSYTRLEGNHNGAESLRSSNNTKLFVGALSTSSYPTVSTVHILDYANTTTYKSSLVRHNSLYSSNVFPINTGAIAGLWRSTSAITSMTIDQYNTGDGNFASGSTFKLYGIEAGNL